MNTNTKELNPEQLKRIFGGTLPEEYLYFLRGLIKEAKQKGYTLETFLNLPDMNELYPEIMEWIKTMWNSVN